MKRSVSNTVLFSQYALIYQILKNAEGMKNFVNQQFYHLKIILLLVKYESLKPIWTELNITE